MSCSNALINSASLRPPEACHTNGVCDCTLGDPSTCPGGARTVCRPAGTVTPIDCASCGDSRSDGLPCKGGGTCVKSSGLCL